MSFGDVFWSLTLRAQQRLGGVIAVLQRVLRVRKHGEMGTVNAGLRAVVFAVTLGYQAAGFAGAALALFALSRLIVVSLHAPSVTSTSPSTSSDMPTRSSRVNRSRNSRSEIA
jgi:hypothetical protein